MNSFLRRTVPAVLLAGGALLATAGPAGAQVEMPEAEGSSVGSMDSLPVPPPALCNGPLASISALSGVCRTAQQQNQVQPDAAQVVPEVSGVQPRVAQSDAAVQPMAQLAPDPDPCDAGECDFAEDEPCDECEPPENPCEECPPETTMPPSSETTVTIATTAPPTTQAVAAPAEELPRTGSTVAPFAVGGAALLALGAALLASKRFALGRR